MSWPRHLAAELLSHYPGAFITDSNLDAIASDLWLIGDEAVASDVVALLRLRCPTVPTGADIYATTREVRKETMSPRQEEGYDGATGEMNADIWSHGRFHLDELLALPETERTDEMRQKACYPQRCGCDKRASSTTPTLPRVV